MLTPICVLRLVELRSRAVTAEEAATPRPAPVLSTKLAAKLTRRGFLVNALQETVPILREGKSTIVRRSKFTGIEYWNVNESANIYQTCLQMVSGGLDISGKTVCNLLQHREKNI